MAFMNILVPVDFSPHSAEAVRVAAGLARDFDAKLTLLHVFQPPTYVLQQGYILYTPTQMREVMAALGKQLEEVRKEALGVGATAVELKQLEGLPAPEIDAFAKAQHCDLIVMGTHGRTGVQHFFLGSVAERVLRHTPCPVLVVPAASTPKAKN